MRIKVLLSLCILILQLPSYGQYTYKLDKTTRFESIGVEQGLSSEFNNCIHQDKYGFVWIGTLFGLNRYDGYEIKVFNTDFRNPGSIYSNNIICIYEEPDGTMWFGTSIGISRYNRATQTFNNYIPDTSDIYNKCNRTLKILPYRDYLCVLVVDSLFLFDKSSGNFQSIRQDSLNPSSDIQFNRSAYLNRSDHFFIDNSENIWIGSTSSDGRSVLTKYDKRTGTFIHFMNDPDDPESFNGMEVRSMVEDQNGILWVATYGGGLLKTIDKEHGKFIQYSHDESDQQSIQSNLLYTVFEDSRGNIWTGGGDGFSRLNKQTNSFINYTVPKCSYNQYRTNCINRISEDATGDLWLSSWDGFFKFNPYSKVLYHYIHDSEDKSSTNGNFVLEILNDQVGQVWILQALDGINILNKYANSFYRIDQTNNLSLSNNHITQFLCDNRGNLWIGGRGGLSKTRLSRTREFGNFDQYVFNDEDPNSIIDNRIRALYEDSNQVLWIGTFGGLSRYNHDSNNFTNYRNEPDDISSISPNGVEAIFEDSHGTLWIGTRSGLNIMDRKTEKFIRLFEDVNKLKRHPTIYAIYEDLHGDVWFGGHHLYKLNRKDTSLIDFFPAKTDMNDAYRNNIIRIDEDSIGNLWFITFYGGLFKVNRDSGTFTSLSVDNGLISNGMAALEIDDSGHIWVSTKAGISRINHQDYSIQNYDTDDGLLCLEFINKSSYRDEEGWIYFGGRHGFNVFHPDSIKDNLHIPPVYITALDVDHQPKYFEEPVFKMNNIELSYHENDFSFSFVALNYVNPKKNQFAYMLEGYDNDWIYVGNERTAHYTNMSPGDYIFRVKASNNNGYWNEEGTSIALVIHPPVWKKWWAYLVYSLAIVGIIYFFYRNELRRLNLKRDLEIEHIQKEKLIEIDREKSNFFANVSHEFRTPLTLILNPIDKVISVLKDGKNKQELSIAYRNAKRLQTLINQLLSLSKLESGKMKLRIKEENIVRLIRANVQSFESLARQNEIDLLFESSVENYLIMVDRLKVGKIMNNLLSNAFKFTDYRGTIKVNISLASKPTDSLEANRQTKSGMNKTTAGISSEIEGVQIKVSDTGIGIRQEYISHIFNRFYQVDSGHNKGYEGTGIGLSLTKELVDLHHGTINVESEIDVGTTFIVFLPAGIDQLNEQGIADSNSLEKRDDNELLDDEYIYSSTSLVDNMSKAEEEDTNKILPKILIVDDNSDMRWFIRNHLEHSYKIVEAVNGEDGFNKAIEHIPDLIITDLMMPVLDGNELTRKVKLDQQTSHIPVIILTAKATLESKLEGLETGADDFLTKPFDAQELIIRIRNLIDLREKLRMSLSKHIDEVKQTKALLEYSCIGLSKLDEEFLKKAVSVIEDQLVNPDFNVESFAAEMAMSRKHLHRKLTSLTDHSPNNLIRNIRLMKAAELIKEGKLNITQISYEVGISSLSYFAKIFKDRFGVSPSDFS